MSDTAKQFKKSREKRIDFSKITPKENNYRPIYVDEYNQFQDSLISRGYPFVQRMAILGTALLEASPNTYGIGGGGLLGLSKERMPVYLIGDSPEIRGRLIKFILDDLETTHPDNWLDGGSGGIRINSGKDGFNMFWHTNDVDSATQILNKSYIRPRDRKKAWDNRSRVARILSKKAK